MIALQDAVTSRYFQVVDVGVDDQTAFTRNERSPLPSTAHFNTLRRLKLGLEVEEGVDIPNVMAIDAAAWVLEYLGKISFMPTRIVASVEGGVAICFVSKDKYADIECFNSGEILAATSDGKNDPNIWSVPQNISGILETVKGIRDYIRA